MLLVNNNNKIKVYAFVGPSGTGKSYRAQMVAGEYDIHYIIDDGLGINCLLYKAPSPRDYWEASMRSSAWKKKKENNTRINNKYQKKVSKIQAEQQLSHRQEHII